jgi:hypothetical protein
MIPLQEVSMMMDSAGMDVTYHIFDLQERSIDDDTLYDFCPLNCDE